MAKRVTNEDILLMNKIYAETKTYAETARQTGFSASTVKKYINPNFDATAASAVAQKEFVFGDFLPFPQTGIAWRELMLLSEEEIEEICILRKEVVI